MSLETTQNVEINIVEQDGDAIELLAKGKKCDVTILANMFKEGNRLILNKVHLDGAGPGSSNLTELRQIARKFGQLNQVDEVIIHGFRRTSGAKVGKQPISIKIKVREE
jgi:hypothetical protein